MPGTSPGMTADVGPRRTITVARDQSVWPARVTPGINRGYVEEMLRDYKLKEFTAACAPWIYRADLFPEEFLGNAFVCDLTADQVRQQRGTLTEPGQESPYRNRSIEENLDLFERMRLNVTLNEELGVRIWSFPMRYQPTDRPDRGHVGEKWSRYQLRSMQIILQATHGIERS